jgi:hypothetical protein
MVTTPGIARSADRIRDAEAELKRELKHRRDRLQYRTRRGLVWVDREVREAHRRLRQSIPAYVLKGSILSLLTAPVIDSFRSLP